VQNQSVGAGFSTPTSAEAEMYGSLSEEHWQVEGSGAEDSLEGADVRQHSQVAAGVSEQQFFSCREIEPH